MIPTHSSIDKRPLTNERILNMTVRELVEHFMAYPEAREAAMGSTFLPYMNLELFDDVTTGFQIVFEFMNNPKHLQIFKEEVRIILKTE